MIIIGNMNKCTGCGACAMVCSKSAIQMFPNSQGFLEPVVDTVKCVNCEKCKNTCHTNRNPEKHSYIDVIIACNTNDEIRSRSTSGGVFFELAKNIIKENGIVIGAAWTSDFGVEHVVVDSVEQISKLQNAKYVQSDINTTYKITKEALRANKRVLFSGTPCQIGGLKSYLGEDHPGLITVELICHGVPSPKVWKKYLAYRKDQSNTDAKEVQVNMRSKSTGWSTYSVEIDYADGTKYSCRCMDDPYMLAFIHNMTLRSSCLECNYKGTDRIGDITLGDCWGIWNVAPEMNDNKGTSLILLNSVKGQEIWKKVSAIFRTRAVDLKEIAGENMAIMKSAVAYAEREHILESLDQEGFTILLEETAKIKEGRELQLKNAKKANLFKRFVRKAKSMIK